MMVTRFTFSTIRNAAAQRTAGAILRRAVWIAAVLLPLGPNTVWAKPPVPFELVRSLEALQDQIATGSTAAQAAQPKLVAHVAERFLAADPEVWKVRKNALSAATYLFSGGRADAVRTVLERGTVPAADQPLLKGALAYADGNDREAKKLLIPLDANALPSLLGAHLALVQATLIADEDTPRAVKLLDLARLLAPGTLVEEAALRREIFIVSEKHDVAQFALLSRRYVRRFKNSVYAGNFRDRLRNSVRKIGMSGAPDTLPAIEALAAQLEPEEQRKLYMSVARSAVVRGNSRVAGFAADRAAQLSREGGDKARSRLYLGASMILTDNYAKGIDALSRVDRSLLSPRERELYDAVTSVSKVLRKPAEAAPAAQASQTTAPSGAQQTAVMEMAERAIADTDALLNKSSK